MSTSASLPTDFSDGRLLVWRLFTDEYRAFVEDHTGVLVTAAKIRETGEGFGMVLSGKRGGEAVCAFVDAEDIERLFEVVQRLLNHDALNWRKDKFAK